MKILNCTARELLDSRGYPTVEVEITTSHGITTALVPSGASTGDGEALELRDGDPQRYQGKGVLKAVHNVNQDIQKLLVGQEIESIQNCDQQLIKLDGTETKSKLGANAILGVSLAVARALALSKQTTLVEYLAAEYGQKQFRLPVPLMNIINGGKHADNGLALQELMIVPHGFKTFHDALRAGSEIFHTLKKILHDRGLATSVGDEGGFAPRLESAHPHQAMLDLIMSAIEKAGYRPHDQVSLALDAASSEFLVDKKIATHYQFEGKTLTSEEMVGVYEGWMQKYPIFSIEDGLSEHDWEGWKYFTARHSKLQLVGDDLFVTNPIFLQKGINQKVANAILIKLNQIGTLTETLQTMKLAQANGYRQIISHRSGETEDTLIASLAVATGCGQIKTGSASRTDRIAKYNELLRLEERLGNRAQYGFSS
jgi:enolase